MPEMDSIVRRYVHQGLNEQVEAIGGHYVLTKEVREFFRGRPVLYLVGYGVFDTSCCGAGGCAYAIVQGFVIEWKGERNGEDRLVSTVERIGEADIQKEIQAAILKKEMVNQVVFL